MSARSRSPRHDADRRGFGLGHVLTLVGALLVLAAAFWIRDGERGSARVTDRAVPPPETAGPPEVPGTVEATASRLPAEGSISIDAMLPVGDTHAAAAVAPRFTPGRSPLEQSPGYFPPDDPESASVRLGRREAPLLEGEFYGGASSLEELCRLVVDALDARDEGALHAMRVTRLEFERYVWPELPQSRPITNITAEDAWSLSNLTSDAGVSRNTGLYGGLRLRYLRVEHGDTQRFTNFDLVRNVEIFAESRVTKEIVTLKLVPSVAVRHGRYKALLYRD